MRRDRVVAGLRWAWMITLGIGFLALLAALTVVDPSNQATGGADAAGPTALVVIAAGLILMAAEDFARAGVRSELPDHVGQVRLTPGFALRAQMALALAIAVALPLALAAWVAALWAWQLVAAGVLILSFTLAIQLYANRKKIPDPLPDPRVSEVLERLCFRADLRVPEFAVAPEAEVATAWTWRGKVVVTQALLARLDPPQLEAVLAHELAHLAHRDAPVMDVAAAPSRLLLSAWNVLDTRNEIVRKAGAGHWLALFMVPYAVPLAAISRLAMLSFSRARDLRADASAAVLTGSPAALAAALLALDGEGAKPPSGDLRGVRPLSVVDPVRPRLGFLALHPSTQDRVQRLQAMEETLQAGPV